MSLQLEARVLRVESIASHDENYRPLTETATLAEFLSTTGPEDIFRPYRTLKHRRSAVALRLRNKQAGSMESKQQPRLQTADSVRLIPQTTKAGNRYLAIKAYDEASTLHTPGNTTEIASPQLSTSTKSVLTNNVTATLTTELSQKHIEVASEAPDDLFSDDAPPHARTRSESSPITPNSLSTNWSAPIIYNEAYHSSQIRRRLSQDGKEVSGNAYSNREGNRSSYASSKSDISLAQSLQMLKSMSEDDDEDYVPPSVVFIGRKTNQIASNRSSSSSIESLTGERLRRLRSNSIPRNRLSRDSASSIEYDLPKITSPPSRRIPSRPEGNTPVLANTTLTPVYESTAWPLADPVEKDVLETRVKTLEDRNRDLEQALRSLLDCRDVQDKDKLLRQVLNQPNEILQ